MGGICESSNHGKNINTEILKKNESNYDPNDQTFDYKNNYQDESGSRPSIFNQTENKNSIVQDIKKSGKPELAQYNRSVYGSGKRSEYSHINKTSVVSSGISEEEIIIKGEINKEAKNKEEDFVNNSFKQEIQNKGGIIITNGDMNSNIANSRKVSSFGNISEILSIQSTSRRNSEMKKLNNNNIGGIISGKYDINGNLIPNNNNNIGASIRANKGINLNNNLLGDNYNSLLRGSNRLNISLHESSPKLESFLNIPKNDQPPPDMDELS